jgi:predicted transcriptional regulator of viral defense system
MIRKNTLHFLSTLPRLFKTTDLQKLHGSPSIFLNRAIKKGLVKRIVRGTYLNVLKCEMSGRWPDIAEIACYIRSPSYISAEWAMNYHGLLLQVPYACTTVTLVHGRWKIISYGHLYIEYSLIKKDMFFGFRYERELNASIAIPEKALLDTIYLRRQVPCEDELELDVLNQKILQEMSLRYPKSVRSKVARLIRWNPATD